MSLEANEAQPLPRGPSYGNQRPAGGAAGQFDIMLIAYAFFKHKRKIIICGLIGLAAAVVTNYVVPPIYKSEAKLLIKYVQEDTVVQPTGEADTIVRKSDPRGEQIINTEIEILTSMDLAEEVAAKIGPERILGDPEAARATHRAAASIRAALSAAPRSRNGAVVSVSFEHRDRTIVQDVLNEIIDSYGRKHVRVHRTNVDREELTRETAELSNRLAQREEELRNLKRTSGGWESIAEARANITEQVSRLQQEIMQSEASQAERQALFDARTSGLPQPVAVNSDSPIPGESLAEYRRLLELRDALAQREREYLVQYTPESLVLRGVRTQLAELDAKKSALETTYPDIATAIGPRLITSPGYVAPVFDRAAEEAQLVALQSRIDKLKEQLAGSREQLSALSEIEPLLTKMQRDKEIDEEQYLYFIRNLQKAKIDDKLETNANIVLIQEPSTPFSSPEMKKAIMAGLALGGIFVGIALAGVMEFVLDQSIRRPVEIEKTLGLPLFFSIPYLRDVAKLGRGSAAALPAAGKPVAPGGPGVTTLATSTGAPPWSPAHGMRSFFDALRDRLVFYFEIRNFTRKPKLIAVAGCGDNSGVSTIASGLAASLSESGDGNVLLVDMNPGNHAPFRFHKGELKCDLDDALEHTKRDDAMVHNNLYVVSHASGDEKLNAILPKRFTKLLPKLKASDYDYIIFDLPPVNQISATPQLARYMDLLLMVVESEKTARETTKRVASIYSDAGVNFGVLVNKTRDYLPQALRRDT